MNLKKILLFILVFSSFLVSCTGNNEEKIIENLGKTLDNYTGYETEAEIKITMDEKESIYKLRENYINEDEIILEILEPKDSSGVIIEYKGDNIFLNNTSINQSISLKSIKGIHKGLLFGEVFKDRNLITSIKEEKIDEINYYIINYTPKDKNKYNKEKIIYLNKKSFKPDKMIVIDENNDQRVLIKYQNFKFNKD